VVRTRTDVALYVLNHKRGHLRDLESSFKVSLSVIADPTVSGQQSYIIDRGEQVHTLEAAKALLVAQAAASPPPAAEEAYDDEETFDIEGESEVETEETEGLTEEASAEGEGQRRKRRRRRRGRGGGEARETAQTQGAAPREEQEGFAAEQPAVAEVQGAGVFEESEAEDEESEDVSGEARADQGQDQGQGERRPRRRGRRGGRRRRGGGGMDEGLAGSISDEFAPVPVSEASEAVADFDGNGAPPSAPEVQPEPIAPEPQPVTVASEPEAESAPTAASDSSEKTPRRSTVREKVSFLSAAEPAVVPDPVVGEAPEPAPVEEAAPAAEPAADQPRRAGWWSRRFGNRE
jgi:ribonuclease E